MRLDPSTILTLCLAAGPSVGCDVAGRALPASRPTGGLRPAIPAGPQYTHEARTPTSYDPGYSRTQWAVTGTTGAWFGTVVAGAGDLDGDGYDDVIVSNSGNSDSFYDYWWDSVAGNETGGQVFIFPGSASGLPMEPTVTLDNPDAVAYFGASAASGGDIDGDGFPDILVGAPGETTDAGTAYLYSGSPDGVSTSPVRTLVGAASGDQFGQASAAAGDVNDDGYDDVIVGARSGNGGTGSAYVYFGSADGGAAAANTTLVGISDGDCFGASVRGAGDVNDDGYDDVIVGAYAVDSYVGAAYVYLGSADGVSPTVGTTLTDGSTEANAFGYSVAGAGDVDGDGYADVVVGAPNARYEYGDGYVWIFAGSAAGTSALASTGFSGGYELGSSVAPAGDVNGDGYADVIVGSDYHSYYGDASASLYVGSTSGLALSATVTSPVFGAFGHSVAGVGDIDGDGFDDVVIGEWNPGRAYLYVGSLTGLGTATGLAGPSHALLGNSVANAGDVDGDGYDDVLVGAPGYLGARGAAWLYAGEADGLPVAATTMLLGDATDDDRGYSVASAGDINGDGYGDVIVGGLTNANVYLGSASGLSTSADFTLAHAEYWEYGWSGYTTAAGVGDLDGDGYDDVIVASDYANTLAYLGSAAGPSEADFDLPYNWIAAAGDVNGDGYADLLVGAQHYGGAGDVEVYFGSAVGVSATADVTLTGGPEFGRSFSSAGDVDGDGYDDIVVGEPHAGAESTTGAAYVFLGGPVGPSTTASTTITGTVTGEYLGLALAPAGDADGDGYDDIVVTGTGSASIYLGSASGVSTTPWVTRTGEATIGTNVAAADVNADGCADLVLGAPDEAGGVAYLFLGCNDDSDGDGYGAYDDCNDADPAYHPGASEMDCADPNDYNCDGYVGSTDNDGDGFEACADCDDGSATVHPGAIEVCDARNTDEDCNNLADDADPGLADGTVAYPDADADGYGSADPADATQLCSSVDGYVTSAGDCDDGDPNVKPTASEVCGDGIDQDCDGVETCYADADEDGFRSPTSLVSSTTACADVGEALSSAPYDCDDADPNVLGGPPEVPGDGVDQDCDGVDLCYSDADQDGYRTDATVLSVDLTCEASRGQASASTPAGDCDDTDARYNPGAVEDCADPTDYNCDGVVVYADLDGDGSAACVDCDDSNDAVHPGVTEVCNDRDDDCDGTVDQGAVDDRSWYRDADGDGSPGAADAAANVVVGCSPPAGYAAGPASDCDDADPAIRPAAPDVPDDGIDQDCDGHDATAIDGCGCASGGLGGSWGAMLAALALVRRRHILDNTGRGPPDSPHQGGAAP